MNLCKLLLISALALLILALAGCAAPQPESAGLQVVASTTILGDVVEQVGGDRIQLTVLLPLEADPHSFQPAPQDLARIAEADLVFVNGLGLEEFLTDVIQNAVAEAEIVAVSENVQMLPVQEEDHGSDEHGEADPHVWMDPNNVKLWVDIILDALTRLDPTNREAYTANARAYQAQLDDLDAWIAAQVETLPQDRRLLVSDHATLAYFAARYGFEQVGALIPGASTLAGTSAQDLAVLQDAIATLDVPAVFIGAGVNPVLAERLAEDTGIQLIPIYTGSLSGPDGPATSYIEMMRYDVEAIVAALN